MNGIENRWAGTPAQYTKEVIKLLQAEAAKMGIEERVKKVQFGHEEDGGSVWLARDSALIVDPTEVMVEGEPFYVGLFKSGETE